jgi:hypothetical protein
MPLLDTIYENELKLAFKKTSWDLCAEALATATDNYVKSGTVLTVVTGTITLPIPPGGTLPGMGTGLGTIQTFSLMNTTLKEDIKAAFKETNWDSTAIAIANAIEAFMKEIKTTVTVTGVLIGSNTSTEVKTSTGITQFVDDMVQTFNNGKSWLGRDDWMGLTKYYVDENVMFDRKQFKCIVEHTSGVRFDFSKWVEVANDSIIPLWRTSVKTFVKSCIIQTDDTGTTPPAIWNGNGIGTIS